MSCIISLFLSQLDQQHPLVDQLICSLLKDTRMNYSKLLRATTTGKKDIIKMGHHLISVTDYILSVDNVACACQLETLIEVERDVFGYIVDEELAELMICNC